jgi:membrane-associated phospholipid phosphatase
MTSSNSSNAIRADDSRNVPNLRSAAAYFPGPAAILAILALACAAAVDFVVMGFSITGFSGPFYLVVLPAVGAVYASRRGMHIRLVSVMVAIATLCTTCLLSAILQYTATAHGAPFLIDHTLLEIDQAIGFDWFGFVAFIDQSKVASDVLLLCYNSIGVQMLAMLVLYSWRGDHEGIDAYIITLVFLISVASVVAACLPAIGVTGIVDIAFDNTPIGGGRAGQPAFIDLRSGALRTIDLDWMNGLITFPSGHAAFAVFSTLAARRIPYAILPVAALNILMLLSTLTHGGHYLCDVIAGSVMAAVGWWIATKLAALRGFGVLEPIAQLRRAEV